MQLLVTSQFTNSELCGLLLEYSGNTERSVTKRYKAVELCNSKSDSEKIKLKYIPDAVPSSKDSRFSLSRSFTVTDFFCHIFCPQKPHNATLFFRGTRIQGRRHLVTAALSVLSCAYRSLRIAIKLDSAAI